MSPRVRAIIKAKAEQYGFTEADLIGPVRRKALTTARFDAMAEVYAVHHAPGRRAFSTPQVGEWFGGRDHSTVIHALQRAEEIFGKRAPTYPPLYADGEGEETRI